jgi:hypothetical protein
MATEAQIKKALKEDGASRYRDVMSPEERGESRSYAPDGDLPEFVEDMPKEKAEKLSKILTPGSWKDGEE